MTWNLLQLFFPLLLLLVPLTMYKSSNRYMAKFYMLMLRNKSARKLYLQMLLIVMLLFHYIYISGHFGEFGVLFSTILCGTHSYGLSLLNIYNIVLAQSTLSERFMNLAFVRCEGGWR